MDDQPRFRQMRGMKPGLRVASPQGCMAGDVIGSRRLVASGNVRLPRGFVVTILRSVSRTATATARAQSRAIRG